MEGAHALLGLTGTISCAIPHVLNFDRGKPPVPPKLTDAAEVICFADLAIVALRFLVRVETSARGA